MPEMEHLSKHRYRRVACSALIAGFIVLYFAGICNVSAAAGAVSLKQRCREMAEQTEKQLDPDFHVVVKSPFVVAGNLSKKQVVAWRDNTVYAASRALWHKFFEERPEKPIRILLLKGDGPYREVALDLFDDNNVSHFGYYRPQERTMIMNIDTGGGTLVHELTHALMAADFPGAPVWFSEAMGSLFEKCTIRHKDIKGLVNWRFPRLHRAVRNDNLVPLKRLFKKTRADFNGAHGGLLYAEARYLALYLQRNNLLSDFYAAFRDNHQRDLTGEKTLKNVTGRNLSDLQQDWIKWIRRAAAERRNEGS